MASATRNSIDRISREIFSLQAELAKLTKKEGELQSKRERAREAASKSKNASTIKLKITDAERYTHEMAKTIKKISDINKKIADKSKTLRIYQERDENDQKKARKKIAAEHQALLVEREHIEQRLKEDISTRAIELTRTEVPPVKHDFFISHASEDKDEIVRKLADTLKVRGADVWYDESTLRIGDSLRRNIDRGLANSRFGVVVLSDAFFSKEWPQRELDGLVALEVKGQTRILPIWHKVSFDQVAQYSPTLADKVALNTSIKSIENIADALMELLK